MGRVTSNPVIPAPDKSLRGQAPAAIQGDRLAGKQE